VVVETDYRAELAKIQLPTLIVQGDKDLSAPLDLTGRKTAQLIPRSRLIVYEGAPHGLMFTHRERLNSDLLAFVKS
jgi:non-heme chloroperoxidase